MTGQRRRAWQEFFGLVPAIFLEPAQRRVRQEFLRARFFLKRCDRPRDAGLQGRQNVFAALKSHPDYARLPFIREKSDALGAQKKGPDSGTCFGQGNVYSSEGADRDIAKKLQRQVQLFQICPPDIAQRERLSTPAGHQAFRS